MKVKSYFAGSVEAAFGKARHELGEDAVMVNSRKAPPEARHLGEYEVVFAITPSAYGGREVMMDRTSAGTGAGVATAGSGLWEDVNGGSASTGASLLAGELSEMKRQLDSMRKTLSVNAAAGAGWLPPSSKLSELYARLLGSELDTELAQSIVEQLHLRSLTSATPAPGRRRASASVPVETQVEQWLTEELECRFHVNSTLGVEGAPQKIVALVGPPGVGKTTTLVKLAVRYGLTSRWPMQVLSMDTYRIAAVEQLRCYASILGVGFQALETIGALSQCLEEHRTKDLVVIDTPGLSAGDMDQAEDLARFFRLRKDIDIHLVLMASTKSADIQRAVQRFEMFHPGKLLFTKLDETGSYGPLLSTAAATGKPLSFWTTGQQVPEDLEPASREKMIALLMEGRMPEAQRRM
jgi:flagellar biosynthesis protein FlhF